MACLEDFAYFAPADAKIERAVRRLKRMVIAKMEEKSVDSHPQEE